MDRSAEDRDGEHTDGETSGVGSSLGSIEPVEGAEHPYSGVPALKNWTPRQHQVVAMYCMGHPQKVIASVTGYTCARVSQIINDPGAQKVIDKFNERIGQETERRVEERIVALTPLAVSRIAETLAHDTLPGTGAKRHQDSMAFKLLEFTRRDDGRLRAGVTISEEVAERLLEGMLRSEEATARYIEEPGPKALPRTGTHGSR